MVTVIIPVFNGGRTLERCIKSVLEQDYPSIETIVIDNASTDNTGAIARAFDDRITYVLNESNLGLARSYTKALHMARTDLVIYLQSDCAFGQRDYVTKILRHFDDPRVGAVTGKSTVSDFRALTWGQRIFAILNLNDISEARETGVYEINFVEARCDAFRTALLRDVGGFNTELTLSNEDQDLSIKIRRRGFRLLQDRSLRFLLGYGGTQDSYPKLLLKQFLMARGQGYIFHRYRMESAEHAGQSLNRMLRVVHRGSQIVIAPVVVALVIAAALGITAALWALAALTLARAGYYAGLGTYYWSLGCRGLVTDFVPLIPTGLLCDVVYGGSFFYGIARSSLRLQV
jgi:cellulose synthase/poly-beta-1,6-N-acetylglucosamine synthase-like glycosyltransferase